MILYPTLRKLDSLPNSQKNRFLQDTQKILSNQAINQKYSEEVKNEEEVQLQENLEEEQKFEEEEEEGYYYSYDEQLQQWQWQEEFNQNQAQGQLSKENRSTRMILVFLAIYIIHALLLIFIIQYFFTDLVMHLCSILYYTTEFLIDFILQFQHWIAGDHIILQYLLIFPKDYLNWYLSPVNFIKSNPIGKYIIKFEHTYIMVTLTLVVCFIIDNIRSYRKLCNLSQHLEDFEESCPICLEDLITPNEEAERIRCGHFFHNSCLSKWIMKQEEITRHLSYNYSCPVCRHPLQ